MAESAAAIVVEIVYALPDRQIVQSMEVDAGTTLQQALDASGLLQRFPEILQAGLDAGIHGKRVDRSTVLQAFDRIEIYRPLIADPKQARRARTRTRGATPTRVSDLWASLIEEFRARAAPKKVEITFDGDAFQPGGSATLHLTFTAKNADVTGAKVALSVSGKDGALVDAPGSVDVGDIAAGQTKQIDIPIGLKAEFSLEQK